MTTNAKQDVLPPGPVAVCVKALDAEIDRCPESDREFDVYVHLCRLVKDHLLSRVNA